MAATMAVVDWSMLDAEILSEVKSWLASLGDVDRILDGWRTVGCSDGGTKVGTRDTVSVDKLLISGMAFEICDFVGRFIAGDPIRQSICNTILA